MPRLDGRLDPLPGIKTHRQPDYPPLPRPCACAGSQRLGHSQQQKGEEEDTVQGIQAPQTFEIPWSQAILASRGDAVCSISRKSWQGKTTRTETDSTHCSILRASEVGQPGASVKYELHITFKTIRSGPVVRSSVRLPYPVNTDWSVAVICPEGSDVANAALAAGAIAVGEETLFEKIRKEEIDFDRLICHEKSEKALNKAGLGRILGPKGLMPSQRMKTIVSDVSKSIKDLAGAADYRERSGVIHLAIGQLGYTPDQLKANITTLMKKIKSEAAEIAEDSLKEIHEVVLSTTMGPALSLNGKLSDEETTVKVEDVSTVM